MKKGGIQLSSGWILCLMAVFLIQQIATVSAIYSMEDTCAQTRGFIANPSDCKYYGYCENGTLLGTEPCPDNLIYNTRRGMCDQPSSDTCEIGNISNACRYRTGNSFTADPANCNRYFYCNNQIAEPRECPTNQIYDSRKMKCVWNAESPEACISKSICYLVPDGTFVGDPENCGKYYLCIGGAGIAGSCGENKYFNPIDGNCQDKNPCKARMFPEKGLGVMKPLPVNKDICKELNSSNVTKYLPDGRTCMGYYICDSEDGPGTWAKCQFGLHFNDGQCVSPYTFPCAFDRCANIGQDFVGAIKSDCHNYIYCKNQVSQDESLEGESCRDGYFFNEYLQRCVAVSPKSSTYNLCV